MDRPGKKLSRFRSLTWPKPRLKGGFAILLPTSLTSTKASNLPIDGRNIDPHLYWIPNGFTRRLQTIGSFRVNFSPWIFIADKESRNCQEPYPHHVVNVESLASNLLKLEERIGVLWKEKYCHRGPPRCASAKAPKGKRYGSHLLFLFSLFVKEPN